MKRVVFYDHWLLAVFLYVPMIPWKHEEHFFLLLV